MKAFKIITFIIFASHLSSADQYTLCKEVMQAIEGQTAPPAAPPERRTKPAPTKPEPQERPVSDPKRGPSVPVPFPGRKAVPTHDPKDIVPVDLYTMDTTIKPFWSRIPFDVRRKMVETWAAEEADLKKFMQEKFNGNVKALIPRMLELDRQISAIENNKKEQVLQVIRQMLEARYGKEAADKIKFDIGTNYPKRIKPEAQNTTPKQPSKSWISKLKQMVKPEPVSEATQPWSKETKDFYIYRRELYNLLQQGAGWTAMKEFAVSYADELNAIEPGLAQKYQEYHSIFRVANSILLESLRRPDQLKSDTIRESIGRGREAVDTQFEIKELPDGTQEMVLKNIEARAVGYNGWAAAHEAAKAGFQVVTPNEASQRTQLTGVERRELDDATNSNIAEIRQGIYGHSIDMLLRTRLSQLLYPKKDNGFQTKMNSEQYYTALDRIFYALPQKQFYYFWDKIGAVDFESNPEKAKEVRTLLDTYLIFDGLAN